MSNFEDVKKFMKTFGQKVITKPQFPDEKTMNLRFDLIKEELNEFISQANYIALNGYEAEMLMNVTGLDIKQLSAKVEALIITKGSQGSIIYTDQEISIAPVKVDAPIDPTGCGDAYRAGLVYGIVNELSWEKTGKLASVMGAIKIQQRGGQNHRASLSEIDSLFGEKLS